MISQSDDSDAVGPQSSDTVGPQSSEADASILITVGTPGVDTPICRLGRSEEIIQDLTVRQLIERVISPRSLFSVGVPMSQLEAESATALAIGELLSADCCEVLSDGSGEEGRRSVSLDEAVTAVARAQVGTQGNRFLNIALDVRSSADAAAPAGEERRTVQLPEAAEVQLEAPATEAAAAAEEQVEASPAAEPGEPEPAGEPAPSGEAAPEPTVARGGIVAIVAERPKEVPAKAPTERKAYVRKGDWLRAQFLPEVEALDFSGLFVGNLGIGIRQEQARKNVVLADPSRVTDILLRANGYRRSGDQAKALICYQELVDVDPGNADFRFLLGKTLLALGQGEQAVEALTRAKELGHEGADRELEELARSARVSGGPLGFLRFWKQ